MTASCDGCSETRDPASVSKDRRSAANPALASDRDVVLPLLALLSLAALALRGAAATGCAGAGCTFTASLADEELVAAPLVGAGGTINCFE